MKKILKISLLGLGIAFIASLAMVQQAGAICLCLADPVMTAAEYQDTDYNGKIDRIKITFDQNMSQCDFDASDWVIAVPGDVGIHTPSGITGVCDGTQNFFYLNVSANSDVTGGTTEPEISYVNNGNRVAGSPVCCYLQNKSNLPLLDDAAPVPVEKGAQFEDTDGNGQVDRVTVRLSQESNIVVNYSDPDWVVTNAGTVGLGDETDITYSATDGLIIQTTGLAGVTGGTTTPRIRYSMVMAPNVLDGLGNGLSTFDFDVFDGAPPLLMSSSPANGATGVSQTPNIQFNLSEAVQPGSFSLNFSPVPSGGTLSTADYQNFTYQNATFSYGASVQVQVDGTDSRSNDIVIPSGGGAPAPNPWSFIIEDAPAGVVSASLSTVSASPTSVTADGSSYSTITVTVNDGSGNPISGKTVTLSSSRGATDTISIVTGTTGADGKASFRVTSSTTGSPTLTAVADGTTITQTATVTFTSGDTTLSPGDRFKSSGSTVYFYGADGKRYIFPTEAVYFSWYSDYSGIKTVADSQVADVALGGNVVPKPGTYLVQFVNMDVPFRVIDPHVYAVDQSLNLRHITSSSIAQSLYGTDWESDIIAVPEVFFRIFSGFGADINFSGDYSKPSVESAIPTPSEATAI